MAATTTTSPGTSPRLKQRFETELKPQLQKDLGLTNVMQVPAPVKIVVNMGVGRATQQRSLLDGAVTDLTIITGQKQLYMDIDVDHGASYGKTIFWDTKAQVPPYLRLANVQFDIDAEKFYKIYIDLMTGPVGGRH